MKAAVGFVDRRDGRLAAIIHGRTFWFDTVPQLALTLHVYGYHYLVEPPEESDWPDYVMTDARLYLDTCEDMRQLREEARLRGLGSLERVNA